MVDLDELKERGEEMVGEWEERLRDWLESTLESLGIATRADIEALEEKIDRIEKLIAQKEKKPAAGKKPTSKKKSTGKKKPTAKKKPSAKKQ